MNKVEEFLRSLLFSYGLLPAISPVPPPPDYQATFVTPTPTPVPVTPTPTPAPNFGSMTPIEKRTAETFDIHQIPRSIAYGIAAGEGGKIGDNNLYNIAAYDSNPQSAIHYDSPEQAATAAAKLLDGTFTKADGTVDDRYKPAWELRSDPPKMLKAIEAAGYAGDPATWKARSAATGGAGINYDNWSDFIMDTSGYKKWAK